MAKVVFTTDAAALKDFMTGPAGAATKLVRKVQHETLNLAKQSSPVDKGGLRGSHEATPVLVTQNEVTAGVEAHAEYAMFVHEGTRPHTIMPRNVKVLAWKPRGGDVVYAKHVNHPGTKAQPWLRLSAQVASSRHGFAFSK